MGACLNKSSLNQSRCLTKVIETAELTEQNTKKKDNEANNVTKNVSAPCDEMKQNKVLLQSCNKRNKKNS